jgi:hypothetical protein
MVAKHHIWENDREAVHAKAVEHARWRKQSIGLEAMPVHYQDATLLCM